MQSCVRLSGEVKRRLAAYRSGLVSLCLSWLFSNFCSHPAGPLSDDSPLLLPLLAQSSLVLISPFFISTSLLLRLRCTVSSRGDTKKDTELHSHMCTSAELCYMLHLAVICIAWPHVQGTSASPSWAGILEWLISQRVKEIEFLWRCMGGAGSSNIVRLLNILKRKTKNCHIGWQSHTVRLSPDVVLILREGID